MDSTRQKLRWLLVLYLHSKISADALMEAGGLYCKGFTRPAGKKYMFCVENLAAVWKSGWNHCTFLV